MTDARELSIAITLSWSALAEEFGPKREAIEQRLTTLLRALDSAPNADAAAVVQAVMELFATHTAAHAILMQALRDASANRPKSTEYQPSIVKRERYTRVKIYYATDRAREAGSKLSYGSGRGAGLSYGEAEVSMPDDHRMGAIERPHWWRLEFRENAEKHVVLASMGSLAEDDFVGRVRDTLSRSSKKQVLLFVHGYRVAFDDAVMRTAQLAYDIHFEGVTALYSWPSEGTVPGYMVDAANVDWSQPRFVQFLNLLREQSGAEEVHLVAHSMGNRLLVDSLHAMIQQLSAVPARLGQVVFAAPDVDAAVFKQTAAGLRNKAKQFTLYASSDDVALKASKAIQKYPRAGDSGQSGADLVIVDPIHTIDATRVDTSLVGHSYYGENRSVLADLFELIRKGSSPQDRFGLVEQKRFGERYWRFKA